MAMKVDKAGKDVTSPELIDAYKNYLTKRNKTPVSAETIKPGVAIPVDNLQHDIEVLEATISTCVKFGLPFGEERTKLNTLKKMKKSLEGKVWPSEEFKAKQELDKLKEKNLLKPAVIVKTLPKKIEDPKGILGAFASHYGKSLAKQLKVDIPTFQPLKEAAPVKPSVSVKVGYGRINIEQEFIMRVGMLSNCNVLIQHAQSYISVQDRIMLFCKQCKAIQTVEDIVEMSGVNELSSTIETFCKAHRHEPAKANTEEAVGRLFRED